MSQPLTDAELAAILRKADTIMVMSRNECVAELNKDIRRLLADRANVRAAALAEAAAVALEHECETWAECCDCRSKISRSIEQLAANPPVVAEEEGK